MKKLTLLAAAGTLLALGGTALAQTSVQATTDLNVRGGPGSQYPVIGVLAAGQDVTINGCNGNWCSVAEPGGTGWVHSRYLSGNIQGGAVVLDQRPAGSGVAVVERHPDTGSTGAIVGGGTGAIAGAVAGGPVGALIGGVGGMALGGTLGEAAEPPARVRTYVTENRLDPVYMDGDVVVGTRLPATMTMREIPDYQYRYVNVNGREMLVEPGTRRVVYVVR